MLIAPVLLKSQRETTGADITLGNKFRTLHKRCLNSGNQYKSNRNGLERTAQLQYFSENSKNLQ